MNIIKLKKSQSINDSDDYLCRMLKNEAESLKAPDSLKTETARVLDEAAQKHTGRIRSPGRILIAAAAVMLSCVMMVSAAGIILNRLSYVPGVGFFDNESGEVELYATDKALDWGITTVESAIRSKFTDAETGEVKSRLTVYVTGVKPRGMYIMLTDGTRLDFREQGFTDKLFVCENFPDEDLFTLSVGYKHLNVTLHEVDQTKYADMQWPADNGYTFEALPLTGSRTAFAVRSSYDPQLYTELFGEELARNIRYTSGYPTAARISFFDENGNEYFQDSGGSSESSKSTEQFTSGTRIIYADTGENTDTVITKIKVTSFDESIDFGGYGYSDSEANVPTFKVPLPSDSETVTCEVPFFTADGDEYVITSVTRDDNAGNGHCLMFDVSIRDGESKYDVRIYSLHLKPTDNIISEFISSWGSSRNTEKNEMYLGIGGVKKKNREEYKAALAKYEGGMIEIGVYGLHMEMRGDWVIDYAAFETETE